MEDKIIVTVPEEYHLERIDRFLAGNLDEDLSRTLIQKYIKESLVTVNGEPVRANYKVKTDDEIIITVPGITDGAIELVPENIPLDIVYQDEHIVVINKQPGLVVHPGHGNNTGTLVNALLFHVKQLSTDGEPGRPGIVHRLDRDTSGLMVAAKSNEAYHGLVTAFTNRMIDKRYQAIVTGKPKKEHGMIELPIARHKKYRQKMSVDDEGREAVTEYWIAKIWQKMTGTFTLVDIKIHTGRTHQIRVHMSATGTPVIGDQIYSKRWEKHKVPYLLLASTALSFDHPVTGEPLSFTAPMPGHMVEFIEKLERME